MKLIRKQGRDFYDIQEGLTEIAWSMSGRGNICMFYIHPDELSKQNPKVIFHWLTDKDQDLFWQTTWSDRLPKLPHHRNVPALMEIIKKFKETGTVLKEPTTQPYHLFTDADEPSIN